jgi:hypothetical protein
VIRFASVRYDRVLGPSERDDTVRSLRSTGTDVTSWNAAGGRTYARARLEPAAESAALALLRRDARVDVPALAVLRIEPLWTRALPALFDALGGPGRPAGVVDVRPDGANALILELDCRTTTPALLLALIDVELRAAPGRRITPLIEFDDDVLTAFAGAMLREPDLDRSRLIETYVEPLLRNGAP